MKVLAIMGSPRKGDSYGITKKVEAEMQKLGSVDFEYLFLRDADLQLCRGCFNCIGKGKELCPIKDDQKLIEEKILQADGVIFVSPGYVLNVSALMKNFFDRFAYSFHRPQFFGQKTLLISTGGPKEMSEALKYLTKLKYAGFDIVYKLGVTVMPWSPGQVMKERIDKDVRSAAENFFASLQNKALPAPDLEKLINFYFFKRAALEAK